MSDLTILANERDTILLAEIAALLHNIGKMDPNFLAPKMKDKDIAEGEVMERLLDIPSYDFKRFAAPDQNLLTGEWKDLIVKRETTDLAAALPDEFKDHPFKDKIIQAARRFGALHHVNGPLYRCFSSTRPQRIADWKVAWQEVQIIRGEIARLDDELDSLSGELNQATSHEEKAIVGKKLNAQKKRKRRLEERHKQAKMRAKEEYEQVEGITLPEEGQAQTELETEFRKTVLQVGGESWPLADLLTLFWDNFFYKEVLDKESDADYKRRSALEPWLKQEQEQGTGLPSLLILSHGEISGAEKWRFPGQPEAKKIETKQPHWKDLRIATAFGFDRKEVDVWDFQRKRHELIDPALQSCSQPTQQRDEFVQQAQSILELGLGDTQWPINEINLWDYAATIAALFKSGVARAVLQGEIPTVGDMHWRFLSLRFDGLGYLGQAHHVTDLIGRRKIVTSALDAAQELLEKTYPLGNQVYRDENGVVFVVPDLPGQKTLGLTDEEENTLEALLERAFAEAEEKEGEGTALAGELTPDVREGPPVRGKKLRLGQYLCDKPRLLTTNAKTMAGWWRSEQAQGREICTVCGVRPVGYKPPCAAMPGWVKPGKAAERHVCCVCLHRRGRRAQDWLTKEPHTTIWTDEVSDANGRFALVVGRFGLEGWLDGTLIPTMQKPASFARVRRCWETTRDFWTEVEEKVVPETVTRWQGKNGPYQKKWPRLTVKVENKKALAGKLGDCHTYETVVEGRQVSLVWDAERRDLISAENLRYLGQQLGLEKAIWQRGDDDELLKELKQRIEKASPLSLYEPSEYGQAAQPLAEVEVQVAYVDVDAPRYTPHIPLLTQPALFMALVPANKAMDVVSAIEAKYEREMARVRDRLPLHLGVVIAPRRTPLRAVLEAGRAMLKRGAGGWQRWEVKESKGDKDAEVILTLHRNGREIEWTIPTVMGDGETPDEWYPHLLERSLAPGEEPDADADLVHVRDLDEGQSVYIAPSTFDFEFLDTTARRFEIAYDEHGRRRERSTCPYLLEEVSDLQKVWHLVSQRLTTSQWMALDGLIEEKRRVWDEEAGEEYSDTFKQLVHDALCNAEWKWKEDEKVKKGWKTLDGPDQVLLESAARLGVLNDVINLYHEAMKE